MAGLTYQSWGWNRGHDPEWVIGDVAIITTQFEWMVTCAVKDPNRPYQISVDGNLKWCSVIYCVGVPPAITPPTPVTSVTGVYSSGDTTAGIPQPYTNIYSRGDYIWLEQPAGNSGIYSEPDYEFDTLQEFYDAIDNGDIHQIKPAVYFDVYINGSDRPSLYVNWTAGEDLSPVELVPEVWIGCEGSNLVTPEYVTIDNSYKEPNTASWHINSAGSQSYGGSYSTTYLTIEEYFGGLPVMKIPGEKLVQWGFDGVPDFVNLYLRMRYGEGRGDLFNVAINRDGTLNSNTKVADSASTDQFDTYVRIHFGEPDYVLPEDDDDYPGGTDIDDEGPGRYDPDDPPPIEDFEDDEGQGFDGNAVLTRTYAVSASTLHNIGQKLWTQAYFNVLKVQSNPIENIVSVKGLPMEFTGTAEEIKVGDIAFGINGDKVASVHKISIGSVKYTGYYGNYLDLGPYTKTKVNLPYIGLVEVDPADIFNSTLSVDYVIDLVTGQCMAILTIDGIPYMNVTGQMGFDIPITATDRVQTELRVASAAITAVGGAAGHLIGGDILGAGVGGASSALSLMGADYTSQRTASPSPACASFANHMVYLLIERPLYEGESAGYKHLHGYPCHKYMKLGSLSGFVAVDRRTDINIAMTSEENAMLEQLLTEGVYI